MTLYSDEMLTRFLDGECTGTEATEIETTVNADPALAARLEAMTARDGLLREVFDETLGPVPTKLTEALEAPRSAEVLPFRARPRQAAWTGWTGLAAASAAALAIGALGGANFARQPTPLIAPSADGLAAQATLASALSTARSGQAAEVAGGKLTVALSFKAGDGRLCRQFQLGFDRGAGAGVACRSGEEWKIEGWAPAASQDAGFQAAAGPAEGPVAQIVDSLGVDETLDAGAESRAIAGGWKAG
ncbi:MAG TPA: hypothetical protein VF559_06550 [Caulobacteraceae bacterium]|jgi:hypothetical protein